MVPCKNFVVGNSDIRLTHKVPGMVSYLGSHFSELKLKIIVLAAESGERREEEEGRLGAATASRALCQVWTVLGGRDRRRRP